MSQTLKSGLAAAVLLVWTAAAASAHPHVFVYTRLTAVFDDKGLAGFDIRWAFDEMFSQMILADHDANGNGALEPAEVASIKAGAFDNLKNFEYFTHIRVEATPFAVRFVKDFRAEVKKDKLVYRFFVPCHVRAVATPKTVVISVYDPSYYSSVFLLRNPVSFQNQEPYEVTHRIAVNQEEAYYFDQIHPEEITLAFQRKP